MPVTLTSGGLWLWLCMFPYTPLGSRGHSGIMHTWAWALHTWSSWQSWVGWASTVIHTFIHTTCHLLNLALCGLCIFGCPCCTLSAHAGDCGVGPTVMHIVIYTTCDLRIFAYRGANGYVLSCTLDCYSVTHTIVFLPVMHPYTILTLLPISPSHIHPHAHQIHHCVQLWLSVNGRTFLPLHHPHWAGLLFKLLFALLHKLDVCSKTWASNHCIVSCTTLSLYYMSILIHCVAHFVS